MKRNLMAAAAALMALLFLIMLNNVALADLSDKERVLGLGSDGYAYMTGNQGLYAGIFAVDQAGTIQEAYLEPATQNRMKARFTKIWVQKDQIYAVKEYSSSPGEPPQKQEILSLGDKLSLRLEPEVLHTYTDKNQRPIHSLTGDEKNLYATWFDSTGQRTYIDVISLRIKPQTQLSAQEAPATQKAAPEKAPVLPSAWTGTLVKSIPAQDGFYQAVYQKNALYALTCSGQLLRYEGQNAETLAVGNLDVLIPCGQGVFYGELSRKKGYFLEPGLDQGRSLGLWLWQDQGTGSQRLVAGAFDGQDRAVTLKVDPLDKTLLTFIQPAKTQQILSLHLGLGLQSAFLGVEVVSLLALAVAVWLLFRALARALARKKQLHWKLMGIITPTLLIIFLLLIQFNGVMVGQVLEEARGQLGQEINHRLNAEIGWQQLAEVSGPEFYLSPTHKQLQRQLTQTQTVGGGARVTHELLVIRGAGFKRVVSPTGLCFADGADVYPQVLLNLMDQTANQGQTVNQNMKLGGQGINVTVSPIKDGLGRPVALLVTQLTTQDLQILRRQQQSRFAQVGAIGLGVILVLTFLLLYGRLRPLKNLQQAFDKLAIGDYTASLSEKNKDEFYDLSRIFNKMREEIAANNYKFNTISRSYYRFVPRNIYQILGKDSILNVNFGDSKSVLATIAISTLSNRDRIRKNLQDREFMEFANSYFFMINQKIEENQGVLISNDFNMAAINSIYMGRSDDAMRFSVSLLEDMETDKISRYNIKTEGMTFIHTTRLLYGIAGTEERAFPFLLSAEVDFLTQLVQKFRYTKVGMVITEEVLQSCQEKYSTRYIGFVNSRDLNRTYKLFEVLDKYGLDQRKLREEAVPAFNKALDLFYRNDFYLARNLFSAVLRSCPDDGVARWYLFACDKYFNGVDTSKVKYDLLALEDGIY